MLDVARHFEQSGSLDRAVQLYQRGGQPQRAMELAMQARKGGGLIHRLLVVLGPGAADVVLGGVTAAAPAGGAAGLDGGAGGGAGTGNGPRATQPGTDGRLPPHPPSCRRLPQPPSPCARTPPPAPCGDPRPRPNLPRQCAEILLREGSHAEALRLLILARRFDEALATAARYALPIDERQAEEMTPPKEGTDPAVVRGVLGFAF